MTFIQSAFCALLSLLFAQRSFVIGQNLRNDECLISNRHTEVVPDADVTIGVLLNVHQPGKGIYGCGLKIYDTCGNQGAAVSQLTEWFPELFSDSESCLAKSNASDRILGLIDTTRLTSLPHVIGSLHDYAIPIIPLDFRSAISPDHLAMTIAEVALDMEWNKIAVLHTSDKHSIRLTETLGHLAAIGNLCIVKVKSIQWKEDEGILSGRKLYGKLLNSLAVELEDKTPVIVIGYGLIIQRFIQAMAENLQMVARFQWIFSWIPDMDSLTSLANALNERNIFSVAVYPQAVLCSNHRLLVSPGQVLLRTSRAIPSIHALFTYAHALRKAWEIKCSGRPGACSSFQQMSGREFMWQYLKPLEFTLRANNRSPPEVSGQKFRGSQLGRVDNIHLGLTLYTFNKTVGVEPRQLVFYDSVRSHVVDSHFEYYPSTCSTSGCTYCVKIVHGQLEGSKEMPDEFVMIDQRADVIIPVLLPIHKPGSSPLECSTAINNDAILDLEAALWTLDKINNDAQFLPGVRLGAVVIDTCGSVLKVAQHLSSFLTESSEELDSISMLAVVSATSPEVAAIAESILSPLNLTSVSTEDLSTDKKRDSYGLQTAASAKTKSKAIVEVLMHFGWTFVTVVHSTDYDSFRGLRAFTTEVKYASICIDVQLSMEGVDNTETGLLNLHKIIRKLVDSRNRGVAVVILFLSDHDTGLFFSAFQKATADGLVARNDFVWLRNGVREVDLDILEKFGKDISGSLVFREAFKEVQEFVTHFRRLSPETNKRNPWFQKYTEERARCTDPECTGSLRNAGTVKVMQAVLSIASGLARFRNEFCKAERGLCHHLLRQPSLRLNLNKYIRHTASARPDEKKSIFIFKDDGVGDVPIEIFNMKRGSKKTFNYQQVAVFNNHLTTLANMVTYGNHGEEFPMMNTVSECRSECGRCESPNSRFLVVRSKDQLYLGATFGVHKSSLNTLECGELDSSVGIQHVEAFLWALDQVNNDPRILPGVTLGGVVFDTCNSRTKTSQIIFDFFSQPSPSQTEARPKLLFPDDVMGFIADQHYNVVKPVVDLTISHQVTTLAPEVTSSEFNNLNWYDYVLRLSLPNVLIADAMVRILKLFRWNYISVVHSHRNHQERDLFQNFKAGSDKNHIQLALTERVPDIEASWLTILRRLKSKRDDGARVVVLLLSGDHLKRFFQSLQMITEEGSEKFGHFVWITYENLEVFQKFHKYSVGALSVRQVADHVPGFQEYFQRLNIRMNLRNIWFREYWEHVFGCRGTACYSGHQSGFHDVPLFQDPGVKNVVSSVFALAHSLEVARAHFCPGRSRGICVQMKESPESRELILNSTKNAQVVENGRIRKLFTENNYGTKGLDILNFRQVGNNAHSFVKIGHYTEAEGLDVDMNKIDGFDNSGHEYNLQKVVSSCLKSDGCGNQIVFRLPTVMKWIPKITVTSLHL
ncbi:uncharacterized protein LOC143257733 [Tachypleus tridentatus]|uniref:uncharacterized protein LOC143257733 n=1 Tax=Tachypleus tridentatus TaxID=6853 RepID=UPI003FD3E074